MAGWRTILPGLLGAGVWSGLVCGGLALAGDLDSRFDISPDGASVDFEVRDTARRDVLSRLFDGTGIEIRWVNPSFADERISGQFSGPASAVARQLLARTNFVLVHDRSDHASRLIRVVIVGPAKGEQTAGLAAIAAAMPSAGKAIGAPTLHGVAAVPDRAHAATPQLGDSPSRAAPPATPILAEPEKRGDASGFMKPPPAGATAPLLVPPPGVGAPPLIAPPPSEQAVPLLAPGSGTAVPALRPAQPIDVNN
jgi:hypothetical protein